MLFDRGSAELTADTRNALQQIVTRIRGHYNIVMVKGHSALDDLPEGATPQQLMDLSLRRAQAVADILVSQGVEVQFCDSGVLDL